MGGPIEGLRGFRRAQRLSQRRLAELAGVCRQTIQRIEMGDVPSADTVVRLESALNIPEGTLAPYRDLPPGPLEPDYGARVRARRRALGLSLERLGQVIDVSASKLSRFERGLTIPNRWFAEWTDLSGRRREAIIAKALAHALGFADVRELHDFCMAGDVSRWSLKDDRRSGLWLPTGDGTGVPMSRAFPTRGELLTAHYMSGQVGGRPTLRTIPSDRRQRASDTR